MKMGRGVGDMRRWVVMMTVAVVAASLVGCGNFFVPPNTGGGGGGTGTATGYVYVANLTTSSLNGFGVVPAVAAVPATATTPAVPAVPATPAALSVVSGLPTKLTYQPISMVVTPNNTFL